MAVIVAALVGEIAYHLWGVVQDSVLALRFPYRLDYGEGIVWQQALLMFGPRMYSPSPDLPFIVFHYPPLYHFVVRALMALQLDPLFAGRLISGVSSVVSSLCVVGLVLISIGRRPTRLQLVLALSFGLLFLCLNPVRQWGIWMRVDLLAVCLGLAATLLVARTRFSTLGTTIALLLATGAAFTKQTHLAAGISIFLVGMVSARRQTLIASAIAGAVGLSCAALLETSTHGFFKNIIVYNINPVNWIGALAVLVYERDSLPYIAAMCAAALIVTIEVATKQRLTLLRQRHPQTITLCLTTIHFWVAFMFAFQIVKDGAANNYFLDFMGVGCALLGIVVCDRSGGPVRIAIFAAVVAVTTSNIQYRRYSGDSFAIWTREDDRFVQEIRALPKPVSSDDMVLLLRAGKPIIFEPAIVRALTASGAWDPSALLQMFHDHGFAMALTAKIRSDEAGPDVAAAIATEYPVVRPATHDLQAHLPAGAD